MSDQQTIRTGPLAGTELWMVVIAAASGICQCEGACGRKHRDGRNVPCTVEHGELGKHGPVRLIAAPEDASLSVRQAAALPAEDLRTWCPACWSAVTAKARSAARKAVSVPQEESLF